MALYHYKMGTVMSSPWFLPQIQSHSLYTILLIRSNAPLKIIILHHQKESFQCLRYLQNASQRRTTKAKWELF
jgi:hypothetical protein